MFDDEVFKAPEPPSPRLVDKAREILALVNGNRTRFTITDSRGYDWRVLIIKANTPPPGWVVDFIGISVLFGGQVIPLQTTEEQWVQLLQLFIDTGDFRSFIDVDFPDFLK